MFIFKGVTWGNPRCEKLMSSKLQRLNGLVTFQLSNGNTQKVTLAVAKLRTIAKCTWFTDVYSIYIYILCINSQVHCANEVIFKQAGSVYLVASHFPTQAHSICFLQVISQCWCKSATEIWQRGITWNAECTPGRCGEKNKTSSNTSMAITIQGLPNNLIAISHIYAIMLLL